MTMPTLPDESELNPTTQKDPIRQGPKPTLRALGLRGLLFSLTGLTLTISVVWGAITGLLLALQVQIIDPAGAVGSLALVVGAGAVAAMIAAPIAGAVTDRTRTKWGGRVPWMLGAALATLGVCVMFIFATTIPFLLVCVVLFQFATNFVWTPAAAFIPTKVPLERRGIFSSMSGLSAMIGAVVGLSFGAALASIMAAGYLILGVLLLVVTSIFALINRRSNLGEPKPPFDVTVLLKTFWVNPVRYPNFALAFAGRFLLFAGFYTTSTFGLYLLQSYIGLGDAAIGVAPLLGLVSLAGMVISAPIGGLLYDRLGRTKPLIYITTAIMAVGFMIPLFVPTVPGMLVQGFLVGLGFGAYQTVDFVLISQVLPSTSDSGKDLGIINIATTLPQTIGAGVAATMVTVFGSYAALFPLAAGAVVLGALLLIPVRGVR